MSLSAVRPAFEAFRRVGKHAGLFALGAAGAFAVARRMHRNALTVLTYHQVLPPGMEPLNPENAISVDEFDRQLAYLMRYHHVATGDEVRAFITAGTPLPPNSVFLTFDDGYRNNYTEAFYTLRRHGATAAFFLTTDFVGHSDRYLWFDSLDAILKTVPQAEIAAWSRAQRILSTEFQSGAHLRRWIKSVSRDRREWIMSGLESAFGRAIHSTAAATCRAMTWDHVREMETAGMTIGSHTASHQILSRGSIDESQRELVQSRERIEAETRRRCWAFSYPNGERNDFRPADQEAVRLAGYDCAFTQIPGFITTDSDAYSLSRIPMPSSSDIRVFLSRVTGLHEVLESMVGRRAVGANA